MQIPYGRQSIDDDDIAAVVDVLRGNWLTQGPAVSEFEDAFARICGVPHAVAFSSGTAALHGAVFAAGVGPGDEVITSAMTFAASGNCAAYVGAVPRFADIERSTWNVGADSVGALINARTRLVIPVHYTGLPAPVAEIRATVGDDVKIVEDAAHALGARTPDEVVGACSHSDMAVFSLHPVKVITTGEGGVVTTRSDTLADRLRLFRSHGLTKNPLVLERDDGGWWQEQHVLGFNYRLTDMQAALGRSQLRKLDGFVGRRNEIAARYRELLAGLEALELPPEAASGSRHAYHLFVVRCRDDVARRRLYDHLRERGILAQVHYAPVYFHPWYRDRFGYDRGLCPEAERLYAGCLSLPCFPTLSDDHQHYVVSAIEDAFAA